MTTIITIIVVCDYYYYYHYYYHRQNYFYLWILAYLLYLCLSLRVILNSSPGSGRARMRIVDLMEVMEVLRDGGDGSMRPAEVLGCHTDTNDERTGRRANQRTTQYDTIRYNTAWFDIMIQYNNDMV